MKPKIGDTVQFKKSGITGTVEKIIRDTCVVKTPISRLSAWPEDLIIVRLSEVSLDKEMEEHQKLCDEIMDIQGIKPIEAEIEEDDIFDDTVPLPDSFVERMTHKIADSELFKAEPLDIPTMTTDFVKEHGLPCPNGYIFKDENGNVINTQKIVLEKKKKEYLKTYEECIGKLPINWDGKVEGYKCDLLTTFQKLLICRDAYWKIAGDEMKLGKPWEPDWENSEERRYSIVNIEGDINLPEKTLTKWILKVTNKILVFPTAEMRDAFYENFKELIETVKELL